MQVLKINDRIFILEKVDPSFAPDPFYARVIGIDLDNTVKTKARAAYDDGEKNVNFDVTMACKLDETKLHMPICKLIPPEGNDWNNKDKYGFTLLNYIDKINSYIKVKNAKGKKYMQEVYAPRRV